MKYRNQAVPLIESSFVDIFSIYIKNGLILDAKIFGLQGFSIEEVSKKYPRMDGDSIFCLFEKEFRFFGSKHFVSAKIYFSNGNFISNGFDFGSGRPVSLLSHFNGGCADDQLACIRSIDLLMDDGLNFGSLIINGYLDVRFQRKAGRRNRFKISGISTDFLFECHDFRSNSNTGFARALKREISVHAAKKRYKYDLGINELASYLIDEFPDAVRKQI